MGSNLEEALAFHLKAVGYPHRREFRFHPTRKWRADFLVYPQGTTLPARPRPGVGLLVEVEGLTWAGAPGRHQRADGFARDCEKYAEAMLAGWPVLRVARTHVQTGRALEFIDRFFAGRP